MLDSSDQQRLHKLLSDTIPLLCKKILGYSLELSVEAFIGITLSGENSSKEVVTVSFKETLLADGRVSSYVWSQVPPSSEGLPPPLIDPVAFNVTDSDSCDDRSSPVADSVDCNDNGLERHDAYSQEWKDDSYWAESDEAAVNSGVPVSSCANVNNAAETLSSRMLSFPVKVEESGDFREIADEHEEFETGADLEKTSHINNSYENPYTGFACRYSPASCVRENANARQHCISTVSQSLQKSGKGSRPIIHQRISPQSLSVQHLQSSANSACSKPTPSKMRKTSLPAVNTAMQSSSSAVCI